jgi:hypothetical protein
MGHSGHVGADGSQLDQRVGSCIKNRTAVVIIYCTDNLKPPITTLIIPNKLLLFTHPKKREKYK